MAKKRHPNTEQRNVKLPNQGRPVKRGKGGDRKPKPRPQRPAAAPVDPRAYLTQPLTMPQIQANAQQAANVRYGPAEQALGLQQRQAPAWFDQYKATVQAAPQQVQAAYAPAIQQSQQLAGATGQGVLKDAAPNSEAAQNDALAAASRKALADSFTSMLLGAQGATQNYFTGRAGVADAAKIQAMTQLGQQSQQLGREKGEYAQGQVAQGVQDERQYGLGLQHQAVENAAFGVKQTTAAATIRDRRRKQRASQRDKNQDQSLAGKKFRSQEEKDAYQRAHGLGPYKPAAVKGRVDGLTPAQRQARRKAQQKSVGRIEDNIIPRWEQLKGQKGTVKLPDGTTQSRLPTPSEIKDRLRSEGYSPAEIHLALMVRVHKPLTAADIRAAKRLGIYKIPKSWRGKKDKPYAGGGGHGGGPSGPTARPTSYDPDSGQAHLRGAALRRHNEEAYRRKGWRKGKDGVWRPPPPKTLTGPSTRSYS